MTTIAWDGQTLAADRRVIGSSIMRTTKIRRTCDGRLIGASGILTACNAFLDWLEWSQQHGYTPPKFQENEADSVTALEVLSDGEVRQHGRFGWFVVQPVKGPYCAIGSGEHLALGAMAAGRCASDAVIIAALYDSNTGEGVDVLGFNGTTVRHIA